jgi:hypothetical protein
MLMSLGCRFILRAIKASELLSTSFAGSTLNWMTGYKLRKQTSRLYEQNSLNKFRCVYFLAFHKSLRKSCIPSAGCCPVFGPGVITLLTIPIHSAIHLAKLFEFVRFEALEQWPFIHQWFYSPFIGPWPLIQIHNLFYTVGRNTWMGDQPVARPLLTHRIQTQKKRT